MVRMLPVLRQSEGPNRQLQLVHAPEQDLAAHRGFDRLAPLDRRSRREVDQQGDVVAEDARSVGHGHLGRHAAVGSFVKCCGHAQKVIRALEADGRCRLIPVLGWGSNATPGLSPPVGVPAS